MKFDDNWVDEVGRGFAACGVFLWFPIYCTRIDFFRLPIDGMLNR